MQVSDLFEAYYGRRLPESIEVDDAAPHLHSYVPYLRGQTNLLPYNFFLSNYNLRDPVLLRVWVSPNRGGHEPRRWSLIFAPEAVVHLDSSQLDALADFDEPIGTVHVRVDHPRVATANGEYRFNAFYFSRGYGCAGIHSLGARGLRPAGAAFGPRAIFAAGQVHHAVDPSAIARLELQSGSTELGRPRETIHSVHGPAFFVSTDASSRVTAVWHDSDLTQRLRRVQGQETVCPVRQAFPIRNFPDEAPRIWLDQDLIGFTPKALLLSVMDAGGRRLAQASVPLCRLPMSANLAEVFGGAPKTDMAYAIADFGADHGEFDQPALAYLQMWYRGGVGSGDQTHSMITPSFWTDPLAEPVSYRCRKFAPWVRHEAIDWSYALVNVGGRGGNRDQSVKCRVYTDSGDEEVFRVDLPDEQVRCLDASDLLARPALRAAKAAIVQIESETTNFNAYWMLRDRFSGATGIDHFTGG